MKYANVPKCSLFRYNARPFILHWIYVPARSTGLYMSRIVIAALYHFVSLEDYKELRQPLLDVMLENDVKRSEERRVGDEGRFRVSRYE